MNVFREISNCPQVSKLLNLKQKFKIILLVGFGGIIQRRKQKTFGVFENVKLSNS